MGSISIDLFSGYTPFSDTQKGSKAGLFLLFLSENVNKGKDIAHFI